MRVLFLGAHCDDIELGCGATIHKHKHDWDIHCAVFSSLVPLDQLTDFRSTSQQSLASLGVAAQHHFDFFTNNFFQNRQAVWERVRELKKRIKPDLVFTHHPDEQQDHVTIYEETIRNFQDTNIILYKPTMRYRTKYQWNLIEVVQEPDVEAKINALAKYSAYQDKLYFSPDNILAQLRVYAMGTDKHQFAEGFQIEKWIVP